MQHFQQLISTPVFHLDNFVWSICLSYVSILTVISLCLYLLTNSKSFQYYTLYGILLSIYLTMRADFTAFLWTHAKQFFEDEQLNSLAFFLQLFFYTYYILFVIHFIGLNKTYPKLIHAYTRLLKYHLVLSTIIFIITAILKDKLIMQWYMTIVFTPIMLFIAFKLIPKVSKNNDLASKILIFGIICFMISALTSLYVFITKQKTIFPKPISFFYLGLVIENLTFAIGLSFKFRGLTIDNVIKKKQIDELAYKNEIATLKGLVQGEQKERQRIATDLHDSLGGLAGAALLQFETAKILNPTITLSEPFQTGISLIEKISEEISNTAHNLMPSTLTQLGLIESVKELTENISTIQFKVIKTNDEIILSEKQILILYRILQELVHNILKHSKATKASIKFIHSKNNPHLVIKVSDNGIGFNQIEQNHGIGLSSIKSRIKILDGNININSEKGVGTHIYIAIPTNELNY